MSKEGIQGIALGRKDVLRIHPNNLNIRPDWNCREVNFDATDPDDMALAQSIAAMGVKQPMTAVWEDGKAWLTDGHRRLLATRYAMEHLNADIKSVPVQTEDRYASEAERVLSQIVRNNGKPLAPLETARVYKRLINLGWTEKQIAESIGRSVNWVKGLLELQAAPIAVTSLVSTGQVSATLALSTMREHKENATEVLNRAVETANATGKTKATAKHTKPKPPVQQEAPAGVRQHDCDFIYFKANGTWYADAAGFFPTAESDEVTRDSIYQENGGMPGLESTGADFIVVVAPKENCTVKTAYPRLLMIEVG